MLVASSCFGLTGYLHRLAERDNLPMQNYEKYHSLNYIVLCPHWLKFLLSFGVFLGTFQTQVGCRGSEGGDKLWTVPQGIEVPLQVTTIHQLFVSLVFAALR